MLELRISGDGVTASAVAAMLLQLEVECSVTTTLNVCRLSFPKGALQLEEGVHVIMPDCERALFAKTVWPALKNALNLKCGWVDASSRGFRGCSENFCAPSQCPYASSAASAFATCARPDGGPDAAGAGEVVSDPG